MSKSFSTQGITLFSCEENPITDITDDISAVKKGSVFVCVNGQSLNTHSLARQALDKGASFLVGEEPLTLAGYHRVTNSRLALSELTDAFYGHPSKRLRVIGVTGTNGKTTTARYIRFLLRSMGFKAGYIGTLGIQTGDEDTEKTGYTTPAAGVFYKSLYGMAENKLDFCVTEVSSQALSQKRVAAVDFTLGMFLNLSPEHLDYHKTVKNYLAAKCELAALSQRVLMNADDAYSSHFLQAYGAKNAAMYSARGVLCEYMAKNIRYLSDSTQSLILHSGKLCRVEAPVIGEFSVYNMLAAISACVELGADFYETVKLCEKLPPIPGRAQIERHNGIRVCIDYAHTPNAISQILLTLSQNKTGKLITVFGCGGNRDREKRPLMGKIAANMSDTVILTSDNSRNEQTEDIIKDILKGIRNKSNVLINPDRAEAIRLALQRAKAGDTVLIAGKGNEETQNNGDETVYFSDQQQVRLYFGEY